MLCGWDGNRRSGVALAMRHGLRGLSTYGLNGHRKGGEHPTSAREGYGTVFHLQFFLKLVVLLLIRFFTSIKHFCAANGVYFVDFFSSNLPLHYFSIHCDKTLCA